MYQSTKKRLLLIAATTLSIFPMTAYGLDWRIIQDQIGTQPNQVFPRGKVLFKEDFERATIGEDQPGVTLVKNADGKGSSAQLTTSAYHLKNIPVIPGHFIMVGWKARTLSGDGSGGAFIETSFKNTEGKTLFTIGRHNQKNPPPRRPVSSGKPATDWTEQYWSLVPRWSFHNTKLPVDTRSLEIRFFHEAGDKTITLLDDIRVVDIYPAALDVIADTIAEHQRLLATAAETIATLPDSPKTRLWKQVVTNHRDRIALQLTTLAQQDPTGKDFLDDSDPPLLFARRLADAVEALQTELTHPATVLTYRTRPFPVLGLFTNTSRKDSAGVLPYTSKIEGNLANEVTLQACRGEYEPASIVLWSAEDTQQVMVRATSLTGPSGEIPASNLNIQVVQCWYQRNPERPNWQVLIPRFLLNDDSLIKVNHQEHRNYLKLSFPEGNRYVDPSTYGTTDEEELENFPLRDSDSLQPIDLIGGQNKQIWITAKVPEEAATGEYMGNILFEANGKEIARVKVGLQVLPFSLPPPKTRYDISQDYTLSFYYRGWLKEDGKGKVGHTTKSEEQLQAELRMMYEHGIVAPLMLLHGNFPGGVHPEARFRRHLQIMRETGMSGRPLYLGENIFNRTEEGLSWLRKSLPRTIAVAREYGFTDVYFYGQDEASKEIMQQQIPSWRVVNEVGAKVQATVTYDDLNHVPDELNLLISVPPVSRASAAKRHRLGHKIHCYGFPMASTADPLQWRRNYGLGVWSRDYDGVSPYCFMHNYKDLWNELTDPDYNIAFPTVNGAISTLALEGFREGGDDVRYVTCLLQQIEKIRQQGTPAAKTLAGESFQWIDDVNFFTDDPDLARSQMIDYIRQLTLP